MAYKFKPSPLFKTIDATAILMFNPLVSAFIHSQILFNLSQKALIFCGRKHFYKIEKPP